MDTSFDPPFEHKILVENTPTTVIDCLAEHTPFSKQQLKGYLHKGAVWLKESPTLKPYRVRRAKKLLTPGSELFCYFNFKVLNETIPSPVLIEDCKDFSVWYKPKGVLCQGSKWGDHTTIQRWIETQYQFDGQTRNAMIIHRLDKATDGLMLIAHSHKAAKMLTQGFEQRQIHKIYQAGVMGNFPVDEQRYDTPIDGKPALSFAKRLAYLAGSDRSLVEVRIETGRKHQIRRHLSSAGFPIVGDRLYGDSTQTEDLQLTSVQLSLTLDNKSHTFKLPSELMPWTAPYWEEASG